jgi:hypothetical protein
MTEKLSERMRVWDDRLISHESTKSHFQAFVSEVEALEVEVKSLRDLITEREPEKLADYDQYKRWVNTKLNELKTAEARLVKSQELAKKIKQAYLEHSDNRDEPYKDSLFYKDNPYFYELEETLGVYNDSTQK